MIAEAFLQPARRNGELLLLRILTDAGIYTFSEAIFGFVFGAVLGFILGTVFAHSRLMERGLLPYVVASQTVPILAIAPMVVIWLGAGQLSVAVIAAYLTFFPVTINTLRGMQSPAAEQVELMRSYAASRWTIMWKLRLPAALPYIFTALKVSATASASARLSASCLPASATGSVGRSSTSARITVWSRRQALGVHRDGGDRWHSFLRLGQSGRALGVAPIHPPAGRERLNDDSTLTRMVDLRATMPPPTQNTIRPAVFSSLSLTRREGGRG